MSTFRQLSLGAPCALSSTGTFAITSYTFVNTNDQIEWVFQVPDPQDGTRTVTITRLGYRLTSVTGTSPLMKISLQGIDASANPDGVIKGGGSPASQTFTPAGSATWNWVTLANSYTANVGDFLAMVISYQSGTLNGSNTPVIAVTFNRPEAGFPYYIQNIATVRTRGSSLPIHGYASAGRTFGLPLQTLTTTAISTSSERALRFTFDQSAVASYKVAGMRLMLTLPAAGKSVVLNLYSGTTVIQSVTMANNLGTSTAVRPVVFWFSDATLATLLGGQEYRLAVSPQDATNNVALHQFDFAAAADLDALPGGQQWYLSTRSGGGATAWTDTLTSRPLAELIVSDWTAPSPGIIMATG